MTQAQPSDRAWRTFALEQAGRIGRRKQGREVLFRVNADRLDQGTRAVAEVARQLDRRLDTIKHLAEVAHAQARGPTPEGRT